MAPDRSAGVIGGSASAMEPKVSDAGGAGLFPLFEDAGGRCGGLSGDRVARARSVRRVGR